MVSLIIFGAIYFYCNSLSKDKDQEKYIFGRTTKAEMIRNAKYYLLFIIIISIIGIVLGLTRIIIYKIKLC